jgi:hypothetical protein
MSVPPPNIDYSQEPGGGALEGAPPPVRAAIAGPLRHSRRAALNARRVDVAIGVLAGVAAVLFVPGIALAGIGAVVVLAVVGISLLYRRLRARRTGRSRRGRR